jgi:hypothetical protein
MFSFQSCRKLWVSTVNGDRNQFKNVMCYERRVAIIFGVRLIRFYPWTGSETDGILIEQILTSRVFLQSTRETLKTTKILCQVQILQ